MASHVGYNVTFYNKITNTTTNSFTFIMPLISAKHIWAKGYFIN